MSKPPERERRGGYRSSNSSSEISVFVGDLDANVTEQDLMNHFSQFYRSIVGTSVIKDTVTRRSKRYGFVRFSDEAEADRSIQEQNG